MNRKLLIVALIVISVVCLASCVKTDEVASVELCGLKEVYDLDEALTAEEAYILVTYESGNTVRHELSLDMITGFDSSTTGIKIMRAESGVYSAEWEYEVIYSKHPTKTVSSTARVSIEQNRYPTGISRAILTELGDLTEVAALTFTLNGSQEFADEAFSRISVETAEGWYSALYYSGPTQVKVLLYGGRLTADGCVAVINISGEMMSVVCTDITVSDGVTEYYLPDTEEI